MRLNHLLTEFSHLVALYQLYLGHIVGLYVTVT